MKKTNPISIKILVLLLHFFFWLFFSTPMSATTNNFYLSVRFVRLYFNPHHILVCNKSLTFTSTNRRPPDTHTHSPPYHNKKEPYCAIELIQILNLWLPIEWRENCNELKTKYFINKRER